jgi:hypothetical protein
MLSAHAQRSNDPRTGYASRAFRPADLNIIEGEFCKRQVRKAARRREHHHDPFETFANRSASFGEDGSYLIETVKLLDSFREVRRGRVIKL